MNSAIHPTAIIDPAAEVGANVAIGPYTVIEGRVKIGAGCRIGPHCHFSGDTTIGPDCEVHAGAIIGDTPQDVHFAGEASGTVIGARCILREYVTIHRGTDPGTNTVIGDDCMLMGFAHVAHNCRLGNQVTVANLTLLAGHVEVGERAFISGSVVVHQFVRIGALAMISGATRLGQDVPPYCIVNPTGVVAPNQVGLRRAGMGAEVVRAIKDAIRSTWVAGPRPDSAMAELEARHPGIPQVAEWVRFVNASKRGLMRRSRPSLKPERDDG